MPKPWVRPRERRVLTKEMDELMEEKNIAKRVLDCILSREVKNQCCNVAYECLHLISKCFLYIIVAFSSINLGEGHDKQPPVESFSLLATSNDPNPTTVVVIAENAGLIK